MDFIFIFVLPFATCSLKVIRSPFLFQENVVNFFRIDSFNEPVKKKYNSKIILWWNWLMFNFEHCTAE